MRSNRGPVNVKHRATSTDVATCFVSDCSGEEARRALSLAKAARMGLAGNRPVNLTRAEPKGPVSPKRAAGTASEHAETF